MLLFVFDEVIDGMNMFVCVFVEDVMDCINLKIFKVGGLIWVRLMWDLCIEYGILMIIEDIWGGDIIMVVIVYLVLLMLSDFIFLVMDFNSYGIVEIVEGVFKWVNGWMIVFDCLGFGILLIFEVFGDLVVIYL